MLENYKSLKLKLYNFWFLDFVSRSCDFNFVASRSSDSSDMSEGYVATILHCNRSHRYHRFNLTLYHILRYYGTILHCHRSGRHHMYILTLQQILRHHRYNLTLQQFHRSSSVLICPSMAFMQRLVCQAKLWPKRSLFLLDVRDI